MREIAQLMRWLASLPSTDHHETILFVSGSKTEAIISPGSRTRLCW
jgi:hypothetical protein